MKAVARFLATGAYTGYAPVVPGTFGTLPAVLVAPALAALCTSNVVLYLLVLVASIAVAIWAAESVATELGIADPQIIVVDEIVGYFVAMAFLSATPAVLLTAFLYFRLFDILKPPPAPWLESLHGGVGVVADDLYAGLLANLAVRATMALGWL